MSQNNVSKAITFTLNVTETLEDLNARYAQALIPLSVTFGFFTLFGFLGNLLILVVFSLSRGYKRNNFKVFVLTLGVIDIITCVTWTSYELPYREIILDSPSTVVNIRTFHRKTEVFSLSTETKKHTVFSWDCPFNFFKNLIFYYLIFCFIVWSFQLILL